MALPQSTIVSTIPGAKFMARIANLFDWQRDSEEEKQNPGQYCWLPTQHTISRKDLSSILNIPFVRRTMKRHMEMRGRRIQTIRINLAHMFVMCGAEEYPVKSIQIPDTSIPKIICHWPSTPIPSDDVTEPVQNSTFETSTRSPNYMATINADTQWTRDEQKEQEQPGMIFWQPTAHQISVEDFNNILNNPCVKNLMNMYTQNNGAPPKKFTIARLPGMHVTCGSEVFLLDLLIVPDITKPFIICCWPSTPILQEAGYDANEPSTSGTL